MPVLSCTILRVVHFNHRRGDTRTLPQCAMANWGMIKFGQKRAKAKWARVSDVAGMSISYLLYNKIINRNESKNAISNNNNINTSKWLFYGTSTAKVISANARCWQFRSHPGHTNTSWQTETQEIKSELNTTQHTLLVAHMWPKQGEGTEIANSMHT